MNKYPKIIALFLFALAFSSVLSACGKKAPEDVLTRTKQAMVEMKSGNIALQAALEGTSENNSLQASGHLGLTFSHEGVDKPMAFNLTADLDGQMKSPEKDLNLKTVFNLISEAGSYYFKIDDFQTNEESLEFLVPLLRVYQGKWYHLSEDFIPSTISDFQASSADTVKKKQLDDLFVSSPLFTVETDHGTKKINGHETYDLSLMVNQEEFKNYFRQVSQIQGAPFTESDLEQLVAPFSHVKTIEVYIDTETYYIYRALVDVENITTEQNPSVMRLQLTFDGADFDQDVKIEAPASYEDMNPLTLPESVVLPESTDSSSPTISDDSQVDGEILP